MMADSDLTTQIIGQLQARGLLRPEESLRAIIREEIEKWWKQQMGWLRANGSMQPPDEGKCEHKGFAANVAVNRLQDSGGFAADITIKCAQCQLPFQFLGLPGGLSPDRPTTSADLTEARMPIAPQDEVK